MSAGSITFSLQVVGAACLLAVAVGAGKLLWLGFWIAAVAIGPLPPSLPEIATHLGVILVGGSVGLMLAVKAVQGLERNDLRALLIALQIAGLLVPLLGGSTVR